MTAWRKGTRVCFAWELGASTDCGPEAGEVCLLGCGLSFNARYLDRSGLAKLHLAVPLDSTYIFLNLSKYYLRPAMRWELAVLHRWYLFVIRSSLLHLCQISVRFVLCLAEPQVL